MEHKEEILDKRVNFQQTEGFKVWKKDYDRKRYQAIREGVLTYYGGGNLACVRCGFSDIRALSIDHIAGGGSQHRKIRTQTIYYLLQSEGLPDGYQTLCMNCQFIKREENNEIHN